MQSPRPPMMPEGGYLQRGLREVSLPHADAGLRNALCSAYTPSYELPREFVALLGRMR